MTEKVRFQKVLSSIIAFALAITIIPGTVLASDVKWGGYKLSEVPVILQDPNQIVGKEVPAATSVLNYYGVPVTKMQVAENMEFWTIEMHDGKPYIPSTPLYMIGDPTKELGIGASVSSTVTVINKLFIEANAPFKVRSTLDYSTMFDGSPKILWITENFEEVDFGDGIYHNHNGVYRTDQGTTPIMNITCVVLADFTDTTVTVMDPFKGLVTYDREQFVDHVEYCNQYMSYVEPTTEQVIPVKDISEVPGASPDMTTSVPTPVTPAPTPASEYTINYNGTAIDFKDAPVKNINDRTMTSARYMGDAIGATTTYDEATKTGTFVLDGTTVELIDGDKNIYINGVPNEMDVEATIIDGRFYVPPRYLAEAFGKVVTWDDATNTVDINDNK